MELYPDRRDSGTYWKIRESYYEDGKVKKRNVKYLGKAEKIYERFRQPVPKSVELETVSFGPAATLRWAFDDLGLEDLFTDLLNPSESHDFPAWQKLYLLDWRRFLQNLSIRKAVKTYNDQIFPYWWRTQPSSEQRFYQLIGDELDEETIEAAQTALARRVVGDDRITECHFDTTDYTTYVEDDTTYLQVGKSKENVVGRRLVGLALALTDADMPVLGEAYPGNKNDTKVFPGLFRGVCDRLVAAGATLDDVTVVFDSGFDDRDNFSLVASREPHLVAAASQNRTVIRDIMDATELSEFKQAAETTYGTRYVTNAGTVEIGDHEWRVVLSYHDTTREKTQREMDEKRAAAEEVLHHQVERLEGGGRGRPPTENSIREKLRDVLSKDETRLDWSFDAETKTLEWEWGDTWQRKYRYAGVQPLITDHDEWTAGRVAHTYFEQSDIENMFHLTKKALIVPVQPPYVKEDELIRAHLFTVFVGLVCYRHMKRQLPDSWTHEEVKDALKQLDMVVALEDETVQFELANLDNTTRTIMDAMELENYLPNPNSADLSHR